MPHFVNIAVRHLIAAVSTVAISINLIIWVIPLSIVALLRLIKLPATVRRRADHVVDWAYRCAVAFDSFWITRILGVRINIHGEVPQSSSGQMIVVSNHCCWFDILLIQHVISRRGPIVKFLIKRELIFVPIVGWICLALNFPRLARGKSREGREKDFESISSAADEAKDNPSAILSFAEGTRFSTEKQQRFGSRYRYLLNPKVGGLRIMLSSLKDATVVDLTLVYPEGVDISFWSFMGGRVRTIDVYLTHTHAATIENVHKWLRTSWEAKDAKIATSRTTQESAPVGLGL